MSIAPHLKWVEKHRYALIHLHAKFNGDWDAICERFNLAFPEDVQTAGYPTTGIPKTTLHSQWRERERKRTKSGGGTWQNLEEKRDQPDQIALRLAISMHIDSFDSVPGNNNSAFDTNPHLLLVNDDTTADTTEEDHPAPSPKPPLQPQLPQIRSRRLNQSAQVEHGEQLSGQSAQSRQEQLSIASAASENVGTIKNIQQANTTFAMSKRYQLALADRTARMHLKDDAPMPAILNCSEVDGEHEENADLSLQAMVDSLSYTQVEDLINHVFPKVPADERGWATALAMESLAGLQGSFALLAERHAARFPYEELATNPKSKHSRGYQALLRIRRELERKPVLRMFHGSHVCEPEDADIPFVMFQQHTASQIKLVPVNSATHRHGGMFVRIKLEDQDSAYHCLVDAMICHKSICNFCRPGTKAKVTSPTKGLPFVHAADLEVQHFDSAPPQLLFMPRTEDFSGEYPKMTEEQVMFWDGLVRKVMVCETVEGGCERCSDEKLEDVNALRA